MVNLYWLVTAILAGLVLIGGTALVYYLRGKRAGKREQINAEDRRRLDEMVKRGDSKGLRDEMLRLARKK